MYSWLVGRVAGFLISRLNAGDPRPIVRMFARDGLLVFPGRSSFAGEHRGREQIAAWFDRFAGLGPQFEVHDVGAAGPPWNLRAYVHFTDRIAVPGSGADYVNHGVIRLRLRWGFVVEDRTYLDTQKVAELDERLRAAGQSSS